MKKPWYSFLYINTTIGKVVWGIGALLLTLGLFVGLSIIENDRMAAQTANWDGRSIEKGAEIFAGNCASCHGPTGGGQPGRAPALNSHYFFSQRLKDLGFTGSQHAFIAGTVAAGRPSNTQGQWTAIMPTWGAEFGGPLRSDQVDAVSDFIMNWESTALLQTPEEDPWEPFINAPTTGYTVTVPSTTPDESVVREPGELFVAMGCNACHNLDEPQTATERGDIGPNLGNLADVASTEAPDMTPEEYVIQSISDPNAHIAAGYAAGIMPPNFAQRMNATEIQGLAEWLLDPNRE